MKLSDITIDFLENNFPEIVEIFISRGFEDGKKFYLAEDKEMHFCFIRQSEVSRLTSLPKSSIPVEIKEGNFPAPADLTARSRGWLKREIHDWMRQKLEERDAKEKKCREEKKGDKNE